MSITFGDRLIDSGYYDITPEQERELEAREECERRGIDPDEVCADGGVLAWMVVEQQMRGCPVCGGDCSSANPPVMSCPMQETDAQLSKDPMRKRRAEVENDRLRETLIQADLKIRSLPGTDQSDVEFIREALGGTPTPQPKTEE